MASKEIIIIQGRPVGLFLGSGASFPYPSELPTFKHILEEWLSNIGKFLNKLPLTDIKIDQRYEILRVYRKINFTIRESYLI
jgi:hypothetical protein